MASTTILSDNGVSSGSAGYKITAGNDGVLILQTTTSGGTATNAIYVNASQNVGFRTTPAAWGSVAKAIQIGARSSMFEYNGTTTDVMNNGYFDGTNYVYLETATAAFHRMATGRHQLYSAASGTAGATITWTNVLQVEKDYSLALQGGTSSAGTGIAFPATQSASSDANTLDDYEEGTFSPSISSDSTGAFTMTTRYGRYTKVGNLVTFVAYIVWSARPTGGNIQVGGYPFSIDWSTNVQPASGFIIKSATDTYVQNGLLTNDTNGSVNNSYAYTFTRSGLLVVNSLSSAGYIAYSGSYFTS